MGFGVAGLRDALWMCTIPLPPPIAPPIVFYILEAQEYLIKRRVYGQHIYEVEHASFTQLVLSATGGFAHEMSVFINI